MKPNDEIEPIPLEKEPIVGHIGYSPDYQSEGVPGPLEVEGEIESSLLENDRRWRGIVSAAQANGMRNEDPDVNDLLAFFFSKFTPEAFSRWRGPDPRYPDRKA